ncbi:syntaxin-8-like [Anneissia japonica]|uniref:syntaxin-8-like n=1 Tax=Anneissia japonica TaxID=1529436 RepID=UPI001425B8E0|nr:syntaxin-8-like [Anneissia japonica]
MEGFGGDSWLREHEACIRLAAEIMEKINERNELQRNGKSYSRVSANIRTLLKRFSQDIESLKKKLYKAASTYHLTQQEAERRQRLIDELLTKERQLDDAFTNQSRYSAPERSGLMASSTAGFGHDLWEDETEQTRGMSVADIRSQQQQVIDEQDRGLEALSSVIARQKQMGHDIGNELDEHNEIIDDINTHIGKTDQRLVKETKHIRKISEKAKDCTYLVVIVLLLIAIVVIIAIPT